MTRPDGQTDPALWVAPEWPPCGSARLGLAASQAGATHYHLTATPRQRGLRE